MHEHDRRVLRCAPLFRELGDAAFELLSSSAEAVSLAAGETLFREGDAPDRFYVVLEGRCEVLKAAHGSEQVEVIATVGPGQSAGVLPVISPASRSATVRASEPTRVAALSIEHVRRELFEVEHGYPFMPLLRRLESDLVASLLAMNDQTVRLLAERTRALEHKNQMSTFIVYVIVVLCSFMFFLTWLTTLTRHATSSTAITLPTIVLIGAVLVRPIRRLGLPWSAYGLTRERLAPSLRDGLLLGLPPVLAVTLFKAWVLHRAGAASHAPLFDPFETGGVGAASAASVRGFVVYNLAYVTVVVPLQEFISRGLLQGLLERFLESRHRVVLAIVISNLIFAAFHLYLSIALALVTLVLGIYLGWIYARSRNLAGPCVAHAMAGVWALTVVRLQPFLT